VIAERTLVAIGRARARGRAAITLTASADVGAVPAVDQLIGLSQAGRRDSAWCNGCGRIVDAHSSDALLLHYSATATTARLSRGLRMSSRPRAGSWARLGCRHLFHELLPRPSLAFGLLVDAGQAAVAARIAPPEMRS